MGGPKKPTLSQLAKRVEKGKQQERREAGPEKSILGLSVPDMDEVISYVKSQKYVTPYMLGERFGFRLSLAKDLLGELSAKGVIRLVTGDNRLRIYAPAQEVAPSAETVAVEAAPQQQKKGGKRGQRKSRKAAATAEESAS
ncbi:MAG: 30S ribosomal protein S25e [Aigarchaeota archaeon]|nr:30S ribosomal protein S25e [Candidatus Pelearchaeum maunauluense]